METTHKKIGYVEWLSAEEMHKGSREWLSELKFIKDEYHFFENLIKSYTLQLIEPEKFSHNTEVIDVLNISQKKNNFLIEAVRVHENDLQIMVDGIDQLKEEEAYKKEHRGLIIEISEFIKDYRELKIQLFDIIKNIKREEKQRRLIDKKIK